MDYNYFRKIIAILIIKFGKQGKRWNLLAKLHHYSDTKADLFI